MARVFITFFMCTFVPFCAYGLYSYYHVRAGLLAAFLTYVSFPIGILVPAFWIFFYGYAVFLTFVAMGLFCLGYGIVMLTLPSFEFFMLLVLGYVLLRFVMRRFPGLLPAQISRDSILIPIAYWSGWVLVESDKPVGMLIGGAGMLYISLGALLAHWRPELGERIGIRVTPKEEAQVVPSQDVLVENLTSSADHDERMDALRQLAQSKGMNGEQVDASIRQAQDEVGRKLEEMVGRIAKEQGLTEEERRELLEPLLQTLYKMPPGEVLKTEGEV